MLDCFQELRRRRRDNSVTLRKANKEEELSKRRNIDIDDTDGTSKLRSITTVDPSGNILSSFVVNDETIKHIIADINR